MACPGWFILNETGESHDYIQDLTSPDGIGFGGSCEIALSYEGS